MAQRAPHYLPPEAPERNGQPPEEEPQHVGSASAVGAILGVLLAWAAWGGAIWIFWNLGVVGAFDSAEPIGIWTADGLAILPMLTFMLLFRIGEVSRG